jgi:hypothetical protein
MVAHITIITLLVITAVIVSQLAGQAEAKVITVDKIMKRAVRLLETTDQECGVMNGEIDRLKNDVERLAEETGNALSLLSAVEELPVRFVYLPDSQPQKAGMVFSAAVHAVGGMASWSGRREYAVVAAREDEARMRLESRFPPGKGFRIGPTCRFTPPD